MEDLLSYRCRNCNSPYSYRVNDTRRLPMVLSCGCTFCKSCLSQLIRGDHIQCTQCRVKSAVSVEIDIKEQLQPNYYLLGRMVAKQLQLPRFPLTHSFKLFTSALSTSPTYTDEGTTTPPSPPAEVDIRCEECLSVASLNCPQCDGQYCSSCFKTVHMSSNSMRRHKPLPLTQLTGGSTHCPSHPVCRLDYYCLDDSVSCCSECCIKGGHRGHQIKSLVETAESQRHQLTPLITKAKSEIQMMKTSSKDIDNRLMAFKKTVHRELARMEKSFSRCYTLLQLHQQAASEQLCAAVVCDLQPARNIQAELLTRIQEMSANVKLSEAAIKDDLVLVKDGSSLMAALNYHNEPPLLTIDGDLCPPKLKFDLAGYGDFLRENFEIISSDGVSLKSELHFNKHVNGTAGPTFSVTTPTSSRPPSAQSECYLSSAVVSSGRGSRASSCKSVSLSPSKTLNELEEVDIDETIEVVVSHIVSLDEFYIQSHDQQHHVTNLSASLSSHSPPLQKLSLDALKIGLRCVGVSERDGLWYRVVIFNISTSLPPMVSVKFLDCGAIEDIPVTSLYTLPPSLAKKPTLCVQCHLHAIHPPKTRRQHHTAPTLWSSNANRVFSELVSDKSLHMKVYRQGASGVLSVDLLSFSGRAQDCSSLISQLIDRGVAVLDNRKWVEPVSHSINLGAGDCLDVTVATAENPWDLHVHLVSREKDLQNVLDVLSHHKGRLIHISLRPFKDMLCCCTFTEDGQLYRAKVKEVEGDSVLVDYVDYGNRERVSWEQLYQLPNELLNTPFLAVHCKLLTVQPAASQRVWSEEVSDIFNKMVSEPVYNMVVKETGMPLSVELIDKATGRSLSDLLVEMNMAECSNSSQDIDQQPTLSLNSRPLASTPSVPQPALPLSGRPITSTPSIPQAELPAIGDSLSGRVVHVVSLTHFYVQRYNQQLLTQLEQLKAVNSKNVSKVAPGTAYLASFHGDEAYHRVVVLDELACNKVKVHYMDFGNCLDLSIDELHPLPAELSHTPPLAIPCSLVGGVREYTEDILQRFSELVVDKLLSITVKGVDVGPPSVLLVSIFSEGVDIEAELLPSSTESDSVLEIDTTCSYSDSTTSDEKEMTVCVTYVSSEGIIYGHEGSLVADNLKLIDAALLQRTIDGIPKPLNLQLGQAICAKSAEDSVWYRATVRQIKDSGAVVYFGDYGNCEEVASSDIIAEAVLAHIPPQAVGLKLAGRPLTHEEVLSLSHRLIDQDIKVKVKGETSDSLLVISRDSLSQWIGEHCQN